MRQKKDIAKSSRNPDETPETAKLAALEERLRRIAGQGAGAVAVAYSGGLDSRFLIHAAMRAGVFVRALHCHGPHVPAREHEYALRWAEKNSLPLTLVDCNPLRDPRLATNPEDRCYHCKTTVFMALREAAGNLPLCDGTNASDLGEYRPGLKALAELGVLSPLAETGFAKEDIRRAGAAIGFDEPGQAAQPCLLTRFGYGTPLDAAMLRAVDKTEEEVEEALASLGRTGQAFRFRFETPDTPALHLAGEFLPGKTEAALRAALQRAGFAAAPIRLMPRLSGYFDRERHGGGT